MPLFNIKHLSKKAEELGYEVFKRENPKTVMINPNFPRWWRKYQYLVVHKGSDQEVYSTSSLARLYGFFDGVKAARSPQGTLPGLVSAPVIKS